jgi:hypothetical protein
VAYFFAWFSQLQIQLAVGIGNQISHTNSGDQAKQAPPGKDAACFEVNGSPASKGAWGCRDIFRR